MVETIRTPVFSRYEVLQKLGSGGMGTVYKARDLHLDRWVALKVLPPGLQEDTEALERFKREARALARLKHPGVAAVYDAHVERGFPHMVMEFIEGETLEQVLRAHGPLPVPEVIRLGIELAEALDHIHRHGIVHRDIKTSNIILGPQGEAVVADFGIAYEPALPRISRGALGTPEYMSPEQASGGSLTGQTDLYSLGVVLYECLTGTVPFRFDGDGLAGLSLLMKHVLEAQVPRLVEHRRDAPAWLAAVVERCLAKDPEDRYPSAAVLAIALRMGDPGLQGGDPRAGGLQPTANSEAASAAGEGVGARHRRGLLLISHTRPVDAVAFSPDGRRLASAAEDQAVRIWETATGRLLHTLDGHSGNVLSVAFSPDGAYLATGDVSGTVHLWEARAGALLHTLKGHSALVMSVAFSPNGQHLASGGADGAVRVWDVRKGQLLRTPGWHQGFVLSVAFSPDGRCLASGGADGALRLWDVRQNRLVQALEDHAAWVLSVAFSPDGQRLASGGGDGRVRLWETRTGQLQQTLSGHLGWVMSVAFSPDGARLASAGRDHAVRVWEAASGRMLRRLPGHLGPVVAATFSPDGRYLASGSSDHTVRIWQLGGWEHARASMLRRIGGWVAVAALAVAGLWGGYAAPEAGRPSTAGAVAGAGPAPAGQRAPAAVPEQPAVRRAPAARLHPLFGKEGFPSGQAGWTLIVAFGTERSPVERAAAAFRRQGYRVAVLTHRAAGIVYYRAGVGLFANRAEAVAARRRLAGKALPYDTWLMRVGAADD